MRKKSRKKSRDIISSIIVVAILLAGYLVVNSVVDAKNANKAKSIIYAYMAKQGIKKSDLQYTTKMYKSYDKLGGYYLVTGIKGEDPHIAYVYSYRDNKLYFYAYSETPQAVKQGIAAGNQLDIPQLKKLKFPPLKEELKRG